MIGEYYWSTEASFVVNDLQFFACFGLALRPSSVDMPFDGWPCKRRILAPHHG
jgi:hypothetical protein